MNMTKEIFEILTHEPGTGVVVMNRDGAVLYANDESLRLFFSDSTTRDDVQGKSILEIGFSKEWAQERLALLQRIELSGEECLLRTIWDGKQQFSWFRLLSEAGEPFRVLIVTRRVGAGSEAEYLLESEMAVIQSDVIGLGELCKLTRRELEVLALIGRGLTSKEIAGLLHRSIKTVENHRMSLGNKLHKSNRVELAMMAREAGLTVGDSSRSRVCDS
jgi:DNA-binding CsgD family transcriptional regulator